MSQLLSQLVFLIWTAFLTYRNGPFYTMLELFRNMQIFGLKKKLTNVEKQCSNKLLYSLSGYHKLEYDKEFTMPLHNKVCVITGGSRGIGLEVVRFLFAKGCTIVTGTSKLSPDSTPEYISNYKNNLLLQVLNTETIDPNIKNLVFNRLIVLPLNLTSMTSVVRFADEISQVTNKVDYLVSKHDLVLE